MKSRTGILVCLVGAAVVCGGLVHAAYHERDAKTPAPIVETYSSLADAILATKKAEWNLVHTILASAYQHAQGVYAKAQANLEVGKNASAQIETLAELVAQIGNEGDASIAAIRKRLLEGGHHHNAKGEEQGIYDEGFVIVTREAKKQFLAAAGAIGKLAAKPDAGALKAEWAKVEKEFAKLHETR
jgi:hypothetical protein